MGHIIDATYSSVYLVFRHEKGESRWQWCPLSCQAKERKAIRGNSISPETYQVLVKIDAAIPLFAARVLRIGVTSRRTPQDQEHEYFTNTSRILHKPLTRQIHVQASDAASEHEYALLYMINTRPKFARDDKISTIGSRG